MYYSYQIVHVLCAHVLLALFSDENVAMPETDRDV